jgi:outer membrane protein
MARRDRSKGSKLSICRQTHRLAWRRFRLKNGVLFVFMVLLGIQGAVAQTSAGSSAQSQGSQPAATPQRELPDYSTNPKWFPQIISAYRPQRIPAADLSNSKSLTDLIHDGRIELSLSQFAAAVVENNLTLATDRFNNYFAQADLLRSKSGQAARGVGTATAVIPDALFAAALGAGIGGGGGFIGGVSGVGSITGSPRTVSEQPRGAFDPTFTFDFSWDRIASPLNTLVVAGSPVVTTNTASFAFGYQQAFPTGTSIAVDLANQRQSSTQRSLIYNPDVITRLSATFVQELTNGFGTAVNRRFQTVARNDVEITRQWFLQQVDTTLAQAEDGYWNLVAAQEQVKETEEALRADQQLYENNKMKEAVGTLAPLDVVTAQSQVASTQRDLIVAQTNLQQQALALKTFFSKKITEAIGDAAIVATDPLPDPQDADVPPLEDALATGERNRPEVPRAEKSVQNDQVGVKVSQSFLKPTFNIFGLFATAGLYGNQLISTAGGVPIVLTGGLAQELSQVVHVRSPEYAIGFALTIPIKNRSALADNARASLQERQAEESLQSTENQVGVEVRSARISLIEDKAQVTAAASAVDLSRQTLEAEQKKLAAGLSTPYNIILDQRNLLQAQQAEVQARTTYANALVEMERATGVIREKSHIDAEDALRGRIVR